MAAHSLALPTLSPRLPLLSSKLKTLTLAVSSPLRLSLKHASLSLSPHAAPRSGRGAGAGVVRYSTVESELEQDEEEGQRQGQRRDANFSPDLKLFVGNLPFNVDSAKLAGLFESAGTVEMVEVIYDKNSGQSRGFGFVTMSTIEEVEAAAQQFNGYELGGRALRVNAGPPPPKDEVPMRGFRSGPVGGGGGGGGGGGYNSSNRVYVGNLSWGVDDASLESLFNEQGRVVEAKVVYDRDSGRSRGFGFVTYSSAEEVNNAISSLDGIELDGRNIRVSVAAERPRRQF